MKKTLLLLFFSCSLSFVQGQTEIGGATLPGYLNFEDAELRLNGAGVREKFWMNMYAAGLYLQKSSSDAKEIIQADAPMAIRLHIVSKMITSKRMIEAVDEGFKNATGGNTSKISAEIKRFKSFFEDKINKNDVFDIVYLPEQGVKVYKNDEEKGMIKGMEFKQALFGIWLSHKPADEALKNGLLGN